MAGLNHEQKVRTNRLLTIDRLIREGKYPNTDRLAELVEVTTRTIQRDIEYMRDMYGAPIEYSPARHGFYYSEPNFFIKSVPLTEGELFSIALFDQLLDQYRNTPLEGDLRNIFGKIVQSLPDTVNVDANFLTEQMTFIPDRIPLIDRTVFKNIFAGIKNNLTVTFDYRPLSRETSMRRTVNPYHAVCQKGNWYVIGHCADKGEPRLCALSRVRNVTLTKKTFAIPKDFNP
jgi:predicted DNA-binding transcriptional regulator YafY